MRYNPDTERGILLENIDCSIPEAPRLCAEPAEVWDCQNGGWIPNPALAATAAQEADPDHGVALQLWCARYKLQQLQPGSIPGATVASLKKDLANIARELQRLS